MHMSTTTAAWTPMLVGCRKLTPSVLLRHFELLSGQMLPFELVASMLSTVDKTHILPNKRPGAKACGQGHTGARGVCCWAQQQGWLAADVSS